MNSRHLAFTVSILSLLGAMPGAASAQDKPADLMKPAEFAAFQDRVNEAERLRPLCIRAERLGLGENNAVRTKCLEYFGTSLAKAVEDEDKEGAAKAAKAAAGFEAAAQKSADAAQSFAKGEAEEGKAKLDEAAKDGEAAQDTAKSGAEGADHSQQTLRDDDDGKHRFGGIEFGIGIGFTHDLGNNDRVGNDAVTVGPDRIVRVQTEGNVLARFMLETHYFFTPCGWRIFTVRNACRYEVDGSGYLRYIAQKEPNFGIGPFVALQPGSDNIIDGVGAGLMIGLRRPGDNKTNSFNIGVGVFYDLRARVLGEGIVANQPLPPDEMDVRYRTTSQTGLLVLSSYSF